MKIRNLIGATGLAACFAFTASATELLTWPADAAEKLNALIDANANSGAYAVFDMDNTMYHYDLTESLLPFLEMKGVLTRETLDPSLVVIPFKDTADHKESLNSYYYRLCEVDDMVCYPWVAQSFSGLTVGELEGYVDELMAYDGEIPITYYDGDEVVEGTVNRPEIYQGQVELVNRLMENGIEVYIISAANEEAVRAVASDPQYGYNIKPENVLGVSMLLKDPETGEVTTSRKQIREGNYDEQGNKNLVVTPYLWTPTTWMSGKAGAILEYLDQWKKPIIVAGDTPANDSFMLFHSTDVVNGGVRIWVDRKDKYMVQIEEMWTKYAAEQTALGQDPTADKNWIVVKDEEIQ
ncbi:HAD family hydrolase [Roseovarius sp. M141]|uniref:HAD family hydrolase n=1 Tax=Roseovarius sp. M141 TaxID=2583806 RepID=UPI0020CCC051|nr:HAD family hydrolase [Roseovarius sp. M141]MCQ0091960.1 HAD family hydrolase [Roseovarius sp. M141]